MQRALFDQSIDQYVHVRYASFLFTALHLQTLLADLYYENISFARWLNEAVSRGRWTDTAREKGFRLRVGKRSLHLLLFLENKFMLPAAQISFELKTALNKKFILKKDTPSAF